MKFKAIANKVFLLKPDFIMVINEIIIPEIKTKGDKKNVSKIRF